MSSTFFGSASVSTVVAVFGDQDIVLDPYTDIPPFAVNAFAMRGDINARLDG